jgi:hypothetical protein
VNSPPLAVNQYESGMKLTGRVVHVDSQRFYIQVQSSPTPDGGDTSKKVLEELHKQIQICESKPAPRLSELVIIYWLNYLFILFEIVLFLK